MKIIVQKITKCIKRLFKCLATMTENFAFSLSNRLFCSVTALNLSKPGGRGAVIAFKSAAPARLSSSLSPGSSASFKVRWCVAEISNCDLKENYIVYF